MTLPPLIDDPDRLRAAVEAPGSPSRWGIDTEFVRERTFFPRLCLIQVARGDTLWLVDALAFDEPSALTDLLQPEHGPWVIHAARQDLEALLPITGIPLAPLFDTQVGAALLGFPAQVGYGELVRQLLEVELPKGHARTDWSARPLSQDQLRYAADDVRYLGAVAEQIGERLERAGRMAWMDEDCARLTDPALYRNEPGEAWRRLKGIEQLPPLEQSVLRNLATWRENTAIARNRPRGWILPDEALRELAQRRPGTLEGLQRVTAVPAGVIRNAGRALLECINEAGADAAGLEQRPQLERLTPEQQARLSRLQAACRQLAGELGLAPELLATRRDLTAVVRGATVPDTFEGWRRDLLQGPLGAVA